MKASKSEAYANEALQLGVFRSMQKRNIAPPVVDPWHSTKARIIARFDHRAAVQFLTIRRYSMAQIIRILSQ